MQLYSIFKPTLEFKKLSDISDVSKFQKYLEKVTSWFTEEWGYIHDKNKTFEEAIQSRKERFAESADKIYLAFYGQIVIGAFRIGNKEYAKELMKSQDKKGWKEKLQISEIWFIYVDKPFRSLGGGRQIIEEIKRRSIKELGASMILLETLKPSLNYFYINQGARLLAESQMNCYPTDVLKFNLPLKDSGISMALNS